MARPIRVEYEGAVYHVTARGNERRLIYRTDRDRRTFLSAVEEAVEQHGLRLHGYCLMPNHYHLLVETPRGNLSRAIGWLQTAYSIRFNCRHRRSGHLFQGRFKAHLIEEDNYATTLLRYIHLNPVRPRDKQAAIPEERRSMLEGYPWSSHLAYAGKAATPAWLCTDWLSFLDRRRTEARRRYRRIMDEAFGRVVENPWDELRLGLALGGEAMVARVRKLLLEKTGQEEVAWVARSESGEKRVELGRLLATGERDRRWQVWIRARLGVERKIDLAREFGYRDGSGITQIIKRLEAEAAAQPTPAKKMAGLRASFQKRASRVWS